jgi:hypothetical protein
MKLPPFIRTSHDNFVAFNILNATPDLQKELRLYFVISCTYFRLYVQTTSGVHPDYSPMYIYIGESMGVRRPTCLSTNLNLVPKFIISYSYTSYDIPVLHIHGATLE